MQTTSPDPLLGRVLDQRYQVERRIAAGGMAVVYEATDLRLDRTVALKAMHPALTHDPRFVERFIREARAAARLAHPNVVGVYDQGDHDGVVYLVMEYVAGHTLRDELNRRPRLTVRQAFEVLQPVLAALSAAHRAGIVHRDVKPENVLLAADGQVKVADFGLAKAVSAASSVTANTGVLMGTVSYLPPELVQRGISDPRGDVYSTGVLLFEMLTGSKPYQGTESSHLIFQHLNADVPAPSTLVPTLPASIDALVAEATARDPELRLPDAGAMLDRLVAVRGRLTDEELDDASLPLGFGAEPTMVLGSHPGHVDGSAPGAGRPAGPEPTRRVAPESPLGSPVAARRDDRVSPPVRLAPARRRRRGLVITILILLLVAALAAGAWYLGAGPGAYTSTPPVLGLTRTQAEARILQDGLRVRLGTARYDEKAPANTVLATTPAPLNRVRKGGTVTLVLSRGPERVRVPSLAGKTLDQATAAAKSARLTLLQGTPAFHDTVPTGQVISQTPGPNQPVRPGSSVTVVLSKGPQLFRVPNVVGRTRDDATSAIKDAYLTPQVDQAYSDSVPLGQVISQDPASGQVRRDTVVTIVVSKGPQLFPVPNVFGKRVEEATKILTEAGFQVRVHKSLGGVFGLVRGQSTTKPSPKGTVITLDVV